MIRIRWFRICFSACLIILITMGILFCYMSALSAGTYAASDEDKKSQDFLDILKNGNGWSIQPSDAEIAQALEALKKRDQENVNQPPPYQSHTYPYDIVNTTYSYGAPEKLHNTVIKDRFPEYANNVAVLVTVETVITTVGYDIDTQAEVRREQKSTSTEYKFLIQNGANFSFSEVGIKTLNGSDGTLLFASGWIIPAKNAFKLTGTITDAKGRPMANILCSIKVGSNNEALLEIGENGYYEYSFELPENASDSDRKVDFKIAFNYRKNKKDWMIMYQYPKPASLPDNIVVVSSFYVDQENKEQKKNISFAAADRNYISSTGNTPDKAASNTGDVKKLKNYSIAYVDFHEAIKFGNENLKVDYSNNMPLKVEMESGELTAYNYKTNTIQLEKKNIGDFSFAHFAYRHEFGHYLQYTAYGNRFPAGSEEGNPRNRAHRGYVNDGSGDSFIEGFATYYAALVAKYKVNPEKDPALIGDMGSLEDGWKTWENNGINEEFAFAAVLWDLTTKVGIPYQEMWDVLKIDRGTFTVYYDKFIELYKDKKQYIQSRYIIHGIYAIKLPGNNRYDPGEPYIDDNKDGKWNPDEYFIDFSVDPSTGNQFMGVTNDMKIGQASNYSRIEKRYSTYHFPNSYLKVLGEAPEILTVRVVRSDGSEYQYTAPVYEGRIYVGLPPPSVEGKIYVLNAEEAGSKSYYEADLQDMVGSLKAPEALTVWIPLP